MIIFSNAVSRWLDPSDRLCLALDRLAEAPPPSASAKKVSNLEDSNLFQCERKLGDGHFFAAIKVLSSSGVAPLSTAILQALESKHPFAPPLELPSIPCDEKALSVSKHEVLRVIHNFPKGTSCGRLNILWTCWEGRRQLLSTHYCAPSLRLLICFWV